MKTIKNIITAGLLITGLSTTNLMADDMNALTKATVKLIKDNRTISTDIQDVKFNQSELSKTVDQQKILIKSLSDENIEIREILNKTNLNVNAQVNGAKDTYTKSANNAVLNSQKEMQQLLEENKNLKQELSTYKMFTDTELKLIKSKLDNINTKPVSVTKSTTTNTEADNIIKDFIK